MIFGIGAFEGLGKFHELDHGLNALLGREPQEAAHFGLHGFVLEAIENLWLERFRVLFHSRCLASIHGLTCAAK